MIGERVRFLGHERRRRPFLYRRPDGLALGSLSVSAPHTVWGHVNETASSCHRWRGDLRRHRRLSFMSASEACGHQGRARYASTPEKELDRTFSLGAAERILFAGTARRRSPWRCLGL